MFTPVEADGSCQVAGNISRNAVTQSPLLGRYRVVTGALRSNKPRGNRGKREDHYQLEIVDIADDGGLHSWFTGRSDSFW